MGYLALSRVAFATAAAGLIAAAAAPAVAAVVSDPTTAEKAVKEVSKPREEAKRDTKYCVDTAMTGSHIVKRICKTREEWINHEGFDPVRRSRR
ncbi:MAG: hypothetical protein ACOY45_15880 [Pseudomonadota bacterium]